MASADLSAINGTVLLPGDDGWDAARLFHSGIGEPDLIVRAADVADVRAAVAYAAAEALPIAVRGGGHSMWGTIPGGMVIDLAALNGVSADGDTGRVSLGGGATWGAVAVALAHHGLAISAGDTASVGVGGLTLGGGIGWMVRAWGLACDQLVGAQLVTASGEVVEASETENAELLWALRGGGGNFGVVTRFDFAAHPLPHGVVFTVLRVESGEPAAVLSALREVLQEAPRGLTVTYMDVPPMDPSAPPGATIAAVWIGDGVREPGIDEARALLAPVRELPGVVEDECALRAYADILLDAPPFDPDRPMPGFVGGNTLLVELTDDAIARLTAFRAAHGASVLFVRSLGGAYGDVEPDASAFPARNAQWFVMAGAFDLPDLLGDAERTAALSEWAAIEALGAGVYGNFTPSLDPSWVPRMYPGETAARLAGVKRAWDPRNLFSRNHNVIP